MLASGSNSALILSIILATSCCLRMASPVMRRAKRSIFSAGRLVWIETARNASGTVTVSRYRSAMSSTKLWPESSWMKPSCGIVAVAVTAMAAAASTALAA